MSPRKRRQVEEVAESQSVEEEEDEGGEERDEDVAEKHQEIWDAFRETYFEAIEQLPLTLQRQLSLMRQLDEQSENYSSQILPTMQRYIEKRRELLTANLDASHAPLLKNGASLRAPSVQSHQSSNSRSDSLQMSALPRTPTPLSTPAEHLRSPTNRQQLLAHIAWLSDEVIHISQEKVNLALATHDSVDRHIRILDQAIKEKEIDLAKNSSQPTIHLRQLVVPRWSNKAARTTLSPLDDEIDRFTEATAGPSGSKNLRKLTQKPTKKGKHRRGASAGKDSELAKESTPLTITLPAAQPNEELYCYCNRPSFGEMIACDGENCEREWFHLGCVGLLEPPEGDWYCEDCRGEDS